MVKKFLKQCSVDQTWQIIQENQQLKDVVVEEKWREGKYNGIRLARVAEDNALICKKTKE